MNPQKYTSNISIRVRLYDWWGVKMSRVQTYTHSSLAKMFGTVLLSSIYIPLSVYICMSVAPLMVHTLGFNG